MESLSFESKLHDIYDPSLTETDDENNDLEILPKRTSLQKKAQNARETSQEKRFENLIEKWASSDEGSDYLIMRRNRGFSNGEENLWKEDEHFSIRDSFPGIIDV